MPHARRPGSLALVGALALLAFVPVPRDAPPAPPQESGMKVARLMGTCERCHLDVWAEWQASGHARAWTNPLFQAAIAAREDGGESCARCHAPDGILRSTPGRVPRARSNDRELGVNCVTCHMNGREYQGPLPSAAHGGVIVNESYRTSDWCGSCHGPADDMPHGEHDSGWKSSPARQEDDRSCQSCHMPAVTRPLAEAKRPLKDLQPAQPCRKHRFGVARDEDGVYEGAVKIEARFEGTVLTVRLTPHRGHALAVHGTDEVRLDVALRGAAGDPIATFVPLERVFPGEGAGALAPGRTTETVFDVPAAAGAATLRVQRVRKDGGKVVAELARGEAKRD